MKQRIQKIFSAVLSDMNVSNVLPDVEISDKSEHGDYTTNVAMVAAKYLKKNPMAIADDIKKTFEEWIASGERKKADPVLDGIDHIEIAPPGFINVFLKNDTLVSNLNKSSDWASIMNSSRVNSGSSNSAESSETTGETGHNIKTIMVEYAHPNTHKSFHIGHLRNITTGEAVVRLLEKAGNTVIRVNYQGDVGLHIAKALYGILQMPNLPAGEAGAKCQMINLKNKKTGTDFDYFYPTSVLDTLWDILFFWVARMMMLGLYLTGDVPFKVIHLHARVVDKHGAKMSKSKNNVMNPIDLVDKYGADALRMALVYGIAPGSDISLSEEKVIGMRNFANKLWNIARLLLMNIEAANIKELPFYDEKMHKSLPDRDKKIISDLNVLISGVTKDIEKYRFSDAAQRIYEFTWHEFADKYLEENKERFKNGDVLGLAVFRHILLNILKLLHPFMPFITEEIWRMVPRKTAKPLIVSSWPK